MKFRLGKVWILICTELMGRGIDFKGVNLVINYDFPNSAITYIHRIGKFSYILYIICKVSVELNEEIWSFIMC